MGAAHRGGGRADSGGRGLSFFLTAACRDDAADQPDNTFGLDVKFIKAPAAGQVNLRPSAGMQFFGEVQIDGRSAAMTVLLRDIDGASLWSTTLAPRGVKHGHARVALDSAARVMLGVQPLQPLARDVGVDRRRRDVGMAEQHLHRAQVGAVVQQVRREGVAQRVR